MRDIGIAINLGLILRFLHFRVLAPGSFLLSALDECLLPFAFCGSGPCVSRHLRVTAYRIARALSYVPCTPLLRRSRAREAGVAC